MKKNNLIIKAVEVIVKVLIVLLLLGFGYFVLHLVFNEKNPIIGNISYAIKHPECYSTGGKWITFPSTCTDTCSDYIYEKNNPYFLCGQALTPGCDCGPNECWDRKENGCVDNPK